MARSAGIHHVSAICSDPKKNIAFYTRDLGLRLVKKTVNFDDPGTWHLYYGDETGRPGTVLTFFVWPQLPSGRNGLGMAVATAFAIPEGSLGYWNQRLADKVVANAAPEKRFGEAVLPLKGPDGDRIELVASAAAAALPGWSNGEVPAEHSVRGFHSVPLLTRAPERTARILTEAFGFSLQGREDATERFIARGGPLGTIVDLRSAPDVSAGRQGAGSIHHVAFRAENDAAQAELVTRVQAQGLHTTGQINRLYFRSVYFHEPGGVLFEIATDAPGFTVDEPKEQLGSALKLPPRYERRRAHLEAVLPPLS